MKLSHLVALITISTVAAPAFAQSDWFVDGSASGPGSGSANDPYSSIQFAIEQGSTVDGDTVWVLPGTYTELVDLSGKDLRLASTAGSSVTEIDVSTRFSLEQSAVKIRSGQGPQCVLSGFTLTGGAGTQNVDPVFGGQYFVGGGLFIVGSSPTIQDCVLVGNQCDYGGGAYVERGNPVFEGCTFEGNTTTLFSAGIHAFDSNIELRECTVVGNAVFTGDGGGLVLFGGRLNCTDGMFSNNTASGGGGGGHIAAFRGARVYLRRSQFTGGFALDGNGGAVLIESSGLRVRDCTFIDNACGDDSSNRDGGAVSVTDGGLSVTTTLFERNASALGGAISLAGSTATIRSSTFRSNAVRSGISYFLTRGGAIAASDSSASVSSCRFVGNTATSASPTPFGPIARGGAAWCNDTGLEIDRCVFSDNDAYYFGRIDPSLTKQEPGAQGGALFGPATVRSSLFVGNRAYSRPEVLIGRAEGGAVFGAAELRRCLLMGNEVAGVGPVPDVGPAAEASTLACCRVIDNLPMSLMPLGPLCIVLSCP